MTWIFNPLSNQFRVFLFTETGVSLEQRLFETFSHLSFCVFEPGLNTILNSNFIDQSNHFVLRRNKVKNLIILTLIGFPSWDWNVVDVEFLDAFEAFLDVFVNFSRILAVSE